jgi:magnesium chelatase family protein
MNDPELRLAGVECKLSFQIPAFQIIGRASAEVHEARDRVRAALESSGIEFPRKKIVISLTPGELPKSGTGFDLAIAASILCTIGALKVDTPLLCWGELRMDGSVHSPSGADLLFQWPEVSSSMRYYLPSSSKGSCQSILAGRPELKERVHFISNLSELWGALSQTHPPLPELTPETKACASLPSAPLVPPLTPGSHLILPIVLSALGRHHLLFLGSRGTGKSNALEWRAWLERALHGSPSPKRTSAARVVRVGPHVRPASLIGSIASGKLSAGLLRKAHQGVLLADELLEWSRDSLETLREPLQDGALTLSRGGREERIECQFLLAAAANPCPCGHPSDLCMCPTPARRRYLSRLSGALLDRIGICALISETQARAQSQDPERILKRALATADFFERHRGPPGLWSPQMLESSMRDVAVFKKRAKTHQSLRARHQRARVAFTIAGWHSRATPIEEDLRLSEWFSADGVYESLSSTSRTSLWEPIARKERAIS